jgi:DNA-binding transcriptional ArsR family regulator
MPDSGASIAPRTICEVIGAHYLADSRRAVKPRRWGGVEVMTGPTGWTFLSNHAHVLICIAREPGIRLCDLAERVRITRRAVQRIIGDLEEAGYLSRVREGRRNRYEVHRELTLRHPICAPCTVGEMLDLILKAKHPPG